MTFAQTTEDSMLLDQNMYWVVAPGTLDIMIGKSSAYVALKWALEVK